MTTAWQLRNIPDPAIIWDLQNKLQIDPVLATLLVQRNIHSYEEAQSYFRPKLTELHDSFLMKNMEQAVIRFNQATERGEKIVIYGDYDVDGTTAVSLFLNAARKYYPNIEFYIPDRFSEGYGVNSNAINQIRKEGASLLFTLDCGIKSVEEIALAKQLGMDVIICDHHEPGEIIPDAIILNPKQKDCPYPYKELSGCGVTFKFLQAVFATNNWNSQELIENLDLLTLSIAADIVPVTGENRIFCFYGMEQINQKKSTVIDLMFRQANKNYPVQLSDIVFSIAPRINAAGRIQHASQIVELFTSDDLYEIEQKVQQINELNKERRSLDQQITFEAIQEILSDTGQQFSNVVYNDSWSKGVIGIVASRLVEKNHRPSIVFTKSNGVLTGSGRSIPQVNLYDILSKCEEHVVQFGGHAFACGLTIEEERLELFKQSFDNALEHVFQAKDCSPRIEIDLEIDFDNIYTATDLGQDRLPKFIRILQQMEPFGPENMRPVFVTRNVFISDYKILKGEHYKFDFQQKGNPVRIEGIAFNFNEKFGEIEEAKPVDIVYSIGINRWNGKENLQLEIKELRNTTIY